MAEHMLNGHEVVNLYDQNILVGAEWETEKKYSGTLLKLSIRTKASAQKKHYAAIHVVDTKKKGERLSQYALEPFDDPKQRVVSAELLVAKHITDWCGKLDKTTIFIKSIPRENAMSEPRFWITAIEVDGRISSSNAKILEDRFSLNDTLSVFSITNDTFNVVIIDTDADARTFIDDKGGDISDELGVTLLPEEKFQAALKAEGNAFERIYKPSKIKIKKVGFGAGVAGLLLSGLFGFSYLSQQDGLNYFDNKAHIDELKDKKSKYKEVAKGLKSRKSWDARTYRKETLSQFVDSLKDGVYSPLEISITLGEINKLLPIFSAEWRLTKLTFEDNRFFARYERIEGGNGTYFMLDNNIGQLNAPGEPINIKPFNFEDNGNTRIYVLTPKGIPSRQPEVEKMLTRLRQEEKLDKQIIKHSGAVVRNIDALDGLFDDYRGLDFGGLWLKRGALSLYEEVSDLEDRLYNSERTIKKTEKKIRNFEPLVLKEGLVLGNVMDFVTMMQLDSHYQWSFPVLSRVYPDEKILKRKQPKKKKKKSKTNVEQYGVAIEGYKVEITTQSQEEEGRVKTYGISDMIQLGLLINKPFVNVDEVEYDKLTEQWKFTIHFNRRTPEYGKRIGNIENKEVKS